MKLVGELNALTLAQEPGQIREAVRRAVAALGPTNRFILQPVDALFPDTPWAGVAAMVEAWKGRGSRRSRLNLTGSARSAPQ
jgi:uroporphyrinogen-III decarboxylase